MQEPVRRDGAAAVRARPSLEVREPPTRLLHDHLERRVVPEVHHGLDGEVGAPLGDEHVRPIVAEAARFPASSRERTELLTQPVLLERGQRRVAEQRVLDGADARRPDGLAVGERTPTPRRPPAPPQRGRGHDPDHDLAVTFERDERSPRRDAPHVALRPVDGIEDPAPATRPRGLSVLLAHHAVARMLGLDAGAQHVLRRPVSFGHRRQVGLGLHDEVTRAEARHRRLVRGIRELEGEGEVGLDGR